MRVSGSVVVPRSSTDRLTDRSSTWKRTYVRRVRAADFGAAVVAVVIAAGLRFGSGVTGEYLVLTVVLPPLWIIAVRVVGGYEMRFPGTGSDEFRRVLNAWVTFTAALVLISYLVNHELSRAYLALTMSVLVTLDMLARFGLRKRLHRVRAHGQAHVDRGGRRPRTRGGAAHQPASPGAVSRPRGGRRLPGRRLRRRRGGGGAGGRRP